MNFEQVQAAKTKHKNKNNSHNLQASRVIVLSDAMTTFWSKAAEQVL